MKTWVRRTLWGLGLVLGLPLLLGLLWLLLNVRDVAPQPWPESLALPGNQLADADNLAHAFGGMQRLDAFRLGDCPDADCLPAWKALVARMPKQRETHASFLGTCEAQAERPVLRYEDPVPTPLRLDSALPVYGDQMGCHTWLLARALEAALAGDDAAALRGLHQADRYDRAMLGGGRFLTSHLIAVSLWSHKLAALRSVAILRPALAPTIAPLAVIDSRQLLDAQQRWVRVEANFNRAAVDSLRAPDCAKQAGLGRGEAWLCRLTAPVVQPEFATQLFAQRWLAVHQQLGQADSLPAALPALEAQLLDGPRGLWVKLRHTVPLILDEVARPDWPTYFERAADLQLSAEATRLWLEDAHAALPARASRSLRERLVADPAGGWTLRAFHADSASRLPLRWAPLPA